MGKEEKLCPRCGKKMSLVAAGWYCMKDDVLIDPVTGKIDQSNRPDYVAWLIGENCKAEIFINKGHLIINKSSGELVLNISIEDLEELELGKTRRANVDSENLMGHTILMGPLGLAIGMLERVSTLKISYFDRSFDPSIGVKSSVTLATEQAEDLAQRLRRNPLFGSEFDKN